MVEKGKQSYESKSVEPFAMNLNFISFPATQLILFIDIIQLWRRAATDWYLWEWVTSIDNELQADEVDGELIAGRRPTISKLCSPAIPIGSARST